MSLPQLVAKRFGTCAAFKLAYNDTVYLLPVYVAYINEDRLFKLFFVCAGKILQVVGVDITCHLYPETSWFYVLKHFSVKPGA